jgi:hypothetical protein
VQSGHTILPKGHEKLAKLVQRQQEITDALDLSKNQASNKLDSKSEDTVEEGNTQSETQAVTASRRARQTHQHRRSVGVTV